MLQEFKDFLFRGNIVELAVAFVMGVAFAAVVNSLVNNLVMPVIAMIIGKPDFSDLTFTINDAVFRFSVLAPSPDEGPGPEPSTSDPGGSAALRFRAPDPAWKVATQLFPTADPARFTAPHLQYFMDSPTELSAFTLREFARLAAAVSPAELAATDPVERARELAKSGAKDAAKELLSQLRNMLENLRAAHRLGMSTVWVSRARRRVPFVDLRVASVLDLPRLVFRYG